MKDKVEEGILIQSEWSSLLKFVKLVSAAEEEDVEGRAKLAKHEQTHF